MRRVRAKQLASYAKRHKLVPSDYRRLKEEWNNTPRNERAKMSKLMER